MCDYSLTRSKVRLGDAHHWPDEAGRMAYLAGFHAAQAFLFETIGKVFKTYKGVQKEFLRLTKDDARFDMELRAFLGRAYNCKPSPTMKPARVLTCRLRARPRRFKRRAGSSTA